MIQGAQQAMTLVRQEYHKASMPVVGSIHGL